MDIRDSQNINHLTEYPVAIARTVNLAELPRLELIKISDIITGERIRKDLGDLDSLAADIEKVGLLQEPVVNQDNKLVCGYRRLLAKQKSGHERVLVKKINTEDIVRGEISENIHRKDFTWDEIIHIKKFIEPEIKKDAQNRISGGVPCAKSCIGSSREKVANYVSMHGRKISHTTLAKVEAVYDAAQANPNNSIITQTWTQLNDERLKPDKAYKRVLRDNKRQELQAEASTRTLPNGVELLLGDFREVAALIRDNSIDLVFTDPPYAEEYLQLYEDVAKLAYRVLRPGGSLVVYQANLFLPYVLTNVLKSGLKYWWQVAVIQSGPSAMVPVRRIGQGWKGLLWLVKGDSCNPYSADGFVSDIVVSKLEDQKDLHDWAQGIPEAEYIIKNLTVEKQIVLDPMLGSGTTCIAALKHRRQAIGIELDPATLEVAKANIAEHVAGGQV